MNWLLPASTLLQMIGTQATAATAWADGIDAKTLRTSVISVAQAMGKIQTVSDPAVRKYLETDLDTLLDHIKAESGVEPMPLRLTHAEMWMLLSRDASIAGVGQIDRQVYAVALREGLTIVEAARPEHPQLAALGVSIHVL
jgi:hypothetical protein